MRGGAADDDRRLNIKAHTGDEPSGRGSERGGRAHHKNNHWESDGNEL